MNKNFLKTGLQEFIEKNWDTDIVSVLLKKPIFEGVSQKELAEQLEAKKKCRTKLPTWFNTPNIYYPNKLNIEQTSSEKTAAYKSRLVHGKSLFDMTGGLGVDSYYFSKKVEQLFHCEKDKNLSEIAAHNFDVLGIKNCEFISVDSIEFLKLKKQYFDWIYVDPSRRNDVKGKVFRLQDCAPNIPEHLDLIFEHTNSILLKASPLLDLKMGIHELKWVQEIHVVAVQNEVKEILFVLQQSIAHSIRIKTVDLKKEGIDSFDFLWEDENKTPTTYGEPQNYLYEPNAAILKAGAFKSVADQYGLKKLAPHSHLYTSDQSIEFPGRVFRIEQVLPYSKKAMKKFKGTKANITTRNFTDTVATLRKKFGIKDGGESYLFFTTNAKGKRMIVICKRALTIRAFDITRLKNI